MDDLEGMPTWKPERPASEWDLVHETLDGYAYRGLANDLTVIMSGAIEGGVKWLHVSLSRRSRIPSYDDIMLVKRVFIGDDRKAIMVFPEKRYHVNIHPFCLHLWSCVEGSDGLPEFSHGLGTL